MSKGFNLPKGKNPMEMLGQLQKLQEELVAAQAQLAEETVTGTAGGGAVKITLTGDQRCTAVEMAPALLEDADVEMLQDLIMAALNSALEESRALAHERLGPLTGDLGA